MTTLIDKIKEKMPWKKKRQISISWLALSKIFHTNKIAYRAQPLYGMKSDMNIFILADTKNSIYYDLTTQSIIDYRDCSWIKIIKKSLEETAKQKKNENSNTV
jgi:hypothetical protein